MVVLQNNEVRVGLNSTAKGFLVKDSKTDDSYFNISERSYQSNRCMLYIVSLSMTLFGLKIAMWLIALFQRYWITKCRSLCPWLKNSGLYYSHFLKYFQKTFCQDEPVSTHLFTICPYFTKYSFAYLFN